MREQIDKDLEAYADRLASDAAVMIHLDAQTYDKAVWPAVHSPMLAVLTVAREPVTLEQIQYLGSITAGWADLNAAKDGLLQFLDAVDGRYRLYHATVLSRLVVSGSTPVLLQHARRELLEALHSPGLESRAALISFLNDDTVFGEPILDDDCLREIKSAYDEITEKWQRM